MLFVGTQNNHSYRTENRNTVHRDRKKSGAAVKAAIPDFIEFSAEKR